MTSFSSQDQLLQWTLGKRIERLLQCLGNEHSLHVGYSKHMAGLLQVLLQFHKGMLFQETRKAMRQADVMRETLDMTCAAMELRSPSGKPVLRKHPCE